MGTLNAKLVLNIKTAAEWANSTEVLLEGELGIESDTRLIKVGDGVHTYTNLPYTAASDINDIEGVTVTNPADGQVLTYSNGEWINVTPSALPADTDLSHYDNNTSGFITASDIPALPADTDLSHYDNTTSDFASRSDIPTNVSQLTNDAGYITNADVPLVNNATLTVQKNGTSVATFTANSATDVTADIAVPTKTSELTNDSGFITGVNFTLDDLTDVTVTNPTYGQVLKFDGSAWVNGTDESQNPVWGNITGVLSDQTDLQDALDLKVNITDFNVAINNITARLDKIEDIMSWAFKFTIDTTKSSGTTFEFNYTYLDAYSTIEIFRVDWGDGSVEPFTTVGSSVTMSHTYADNGVYHISVYCDPYISYRFDISSYFSSIAFNTTTAPMLISVDSPYYGRDCASMFSGCTNLATIPANLFAYSGGEDFSHTFDTCSALTTIPADLFKYNTYATTFDHVFYKCTALTAIPEDLFRYNTDVTTFANAFDSCSALASIPEDLFRYNTLVTNFSRVFSSCDALTAIPVDLFRYNTAATNFSYMFERCGSLITVPTDLFRYNTAATNFHYTFRYCASLESVPPYLFRYNTAVTDFSGTFQYCTKLVVNSNMFCDEATEMATRFAGVSSVTFSNCFNRGSYSGEQAGTAPELWNYTVQGGYWPSGNILSCFGGAGNSSTSLTNYANIPSGWK